MSKGKYTLEFKEMAVSLALTGKRSHGEVARELNIPIQTLSGWINTKKKDLDPETASSAAQAAELKQLRKQLAEVTLERDILKKGSGVLYP